MFQELARLSGWVHRVRDHGGIARVEIATEEQPRALDGALLRRVAKRVRAAGFDEVTLDLVGYRAGSVSIEPATRG